MRSPWWQVRPEELAARYQYDADKLLEAIGFPNQLADWQLDLVLQAQAVCEDRQRSSPEPGV